MNQADIVKLEGDLATAQAELAELEKKREKAIASASADGFVKAAEAIERVRKRITFHDEVLASARASLELADRNAKLEQLREANERLSGRAPVERLLPLAEAVVAAPFRQVGEKLKEYWAGIDAIALDHEHARALANQIGALEFPLLARTPDYERQGLGLLMCVVHRDCALPPNSDKRPLNTWANLSMRPDVALGLLGVSASSRLPIREQMVAALAGTHAVEAAKVESEHATKVQAAESEQRAAAATQAERKELIDHGLDPDAEHKGWFDVPPPPPMAH